MHARHDLLARHGTKLSGVGARRGVIAHQEDRAAAIDGLDPLDDLEPGAVRASGHDHLTDPQRSHLVDGAGYHQRAGR